MVNHRQKESGRTACTRALGAVALLLAIAQPVIASTPCELPPQDAYLPSQRSQFLREVSQLSAQCLKLIVRECARGDGPQGLGPERAERCAVTEEALSQKGSDHNALAPFERAARL